MSIPPVPSGKELLDILLQGTQKVASTERKNLAGQTRLTKSRVIERAKIKHISSKAQKHLSAITKSFPTLDQLPEYQKELLYLAVDYMEVKKALGAAKWALKKIDTLTVNHLKQLKGAQQQDINRIRRAYIGRVASVVDQISKQLETLQSARTTLNAFPKIDPNKPVVCIAGFPNVGKSTLLQLLCGSNVEIAPYAFTTKGLNIGKTKINRTEVQCIDTPGTLGRQKRNEIEQMAHIALKYLADIIIYVYDPTESYDLEKQKKLHASIKRYRKPTLLYISKSDVADKEQMEKVLSLADATTSPTALRKAISESL